MHSHFCAPFAQVVGEPDNDGVCALIENLDWRLVDRCSEWWLSRAELDVAHADRYRPARRNLQRSHGLDLETVRGRRLLRIDVMFSDPHPNQARHDDQRQQPPQLGLPIT